MKPKQPLPDWVCDGQTDLTDLVGTEHLSGDLIPGESDMQRIVRLYAQAIRARQGSHE